MRRAGSLFSGLVCVPTANAHARSSTIGLDGSRSYRRTERIDESVRSFYERYPYPPPVHDLDSYREQWRDDGRRRAHFHLCWPARSYTQNLSVLVAGCGTSQAAKYALRWPAARIVGIDFSAASVRLTNELKEKYRLDNLEVRQLAIEHVADLKMHFDHIVCTGVLHHLQNPNLGLLKLRDALKPEGAMHLMVYAPYGRAGVYMLQQFFRRLGVDASKADMDDVAAAIDSLPEGHPLSGLLRGAPDFRDQAALADALLNPRDRAYAVPEFFELIQTSRLRFGRWFRQAPYSCQIGLMSRVPASFRSAQVPMENLFAAAELFRGTMSRHSAVVYRDDALRIPTVSFEGDAWLRYVPIRIPDTICVRDRLPRGMAAILLNRAHTHRDICLPLRESELQIFEQIDGRRSIGEILPGSFEREKARGLFERLWWHDQIVFDATGSLRPAEQATVSERTS